MSSKKEDMSLIWRMLEKIMSCVEERSERNGATSTDNVQNIKGKNKVVEEEIREKKIKGRPNKDVSIRYETRWKGKCSYAEDLYGSESTEDLDYDSIVDSDYELVDEDDEVIFEANVDGDSNKVLEAERMGYAGYISDNETIIQKVFLVWMALQMILQNTQERSNAKVRRSSQTGRNSTKSLTWRTQLLR